MLTFTIEEFKVLNSTHKRLTTVSQQFHTTMRVLTTI